MLAKHLQPITEKLSGYDKQFEELRTVRATPVTPVIPTRPVDPATQMFVDPGAWQSDFETRLINTITEKVVAPVQKQQQDYQQQQALDRFWRDFQGANKDLADDMDIVQAIASQHVGELTKLDTAAASTKLAELSRAKVIEIAKRHTKRETTSPRSTVESPSVPGLTAARAQGAAEEGEPENPKYRGLSGVLRQRAENRRAAKGRPNAGGVH
jgi:hypothetical protein